MDPAKSPTCSSPRPRAVDKSLADLRVIRKLALQDINRLELTLLRGDPLLAFRRDIFMQKGEGKRRPTAV